MTIGDEYLQMHRFTTFCLAATVSLSSMASAQGIDPFSQDISAAVLEHAEVAAFYRGNDYAAIWTDAEADDRRRLEALLAAFRQSDIHALPEGKFVEARIRDLVDSIRTEADRARAEADLSALYLDYAHSVQSGILDADKTVNGIKRQSPRRDGAELLSRLVNEVPEEVMRSLPPSTPEYANLLRAKVQLGRTIEAGGWGAPAMAGRFEAGDRGPGVIALRDRLIALGYLPATTSDTFDPSMDAAVRKFQEDYGLAVDGVVGGATLAELNRSPEERLGQIVVAMERERWLNIDRGRRHIWVNLANFRAQIIEDGEVTYDTRSVVGADSSDRRSPEFSDEMDHMVINPTWHVPRSIAVNEYLPSFRRNPNANPQLTIYYKGQPVARNRINWPAVTAGNWPFYLKQKPSSSNALGLVKFMFPNKWNIYLHDTPSKSLFDTAERAYSHGCIRLQKPFELAYALLAPQTNDPEGFFRAKLNTGKETRVDLDRPVPVHLVYRTAFSSPRGEIQFRPDVYGRDAQILSALENAGVEIADLRS